MNRVDLPVMPMPNCCKVSIGRYSNTKRNFFRIQHKLIHPSPLNVPPTGVLDISNAQKKLSSNQKILSERQMEIQNLRTSNRQIKITLMNALIERDELVTKRTALKAMNERFSNQNENLHREIDDLLRGDEVDNICERFSLKDQLSLLKEIQDARCKLLNYGFPLSFFA
jgi:hypothetical protein